MIPLFDLHKLGKMAKQREHSKGNTRFRLQNLKHQIHILNKNWDAFPELIVENKKDSDSGDMTIVRNVQVAPWGGFHLGGSMFATIKNETAQGQIIKKLRDEDFIRKEMLNLLNSKGIKELDAPIIPRLMWAEVIVSDTPYHISKADPVYKDITILKSPCLYPFSFSFIFKKMEVPTKYIISRANNGYTKFAYKGEPPFSEHFGNHTDALLLVSERENGLVLYFTGWGEYPLLTIEGFVK